MKLSIVTTLYKSAPYLDEFHPARIGRAVLSKYPLLGAFFVVRYVP